MPEIVWNGAANSLLLAALVAAGMLAYAVVARVRYNSLRSIAAVEKSQRPDCMVVIPARNEEAAIARAVSSFPPDTVIVVDDHSEDRTAEAARKAGAGVLPAPPLPRNGLGKSNACAAGARTLDSRWILFADADTWFEQGFLDAAVACAEANGLALLSIYLRPEYETFAERLLVPYARALFFCGVRPTGDHSAMFNGQCLLARREPYLFMGAHAAVVSQLVEDVKLTALAARHRLKVGIVSAGNLGHARMYDGIKGIRLGIERQAARFMVVSPMVGVSILIATCIMALWLPALAWLAFERQWIALAALAVLPIAALRPWYSNWGPALLSPLAIYRMLPILARGLLAALGGKTLEWKGRRVRTIS